MRQDLGQGLKDALKTQMMMMVIFPKCCNVLFGQTLFFIFTIKLFIHDVIKNIETSSLLFKQFLIWSQKANSHSQLESSIQNTKFFKNKNFEMTSPTTTPSISKYIFLYLHLKINNYSKFVSSTSFGLAVGCKGSLTLDGTF